MKRAGNTKICKDGDERELPYCDNVFLDVCVAQADHQGSLSKKNNFKMMKNKLLKRTGGFVLVYSNSEG